MKPENRTVKRRSTLEGQNVKMGFAKEATAHLMSVLTDLYKDRVLACIREYSTNGLDAQIVAGVIRPIEVTTPTALNPVLRIRDFGVGLDAAGIAEVYSQYGASTKRNSDEFNGMLGLGCKAALSYTDQFTVVGVKGGVKTVVAVSRDEDGGGDMRIVSETPTDDPNGVEVQIPTRPNDDFLATAERFFRYWKPGTVLLNGSQPRNFRENATKITDRIFTVEGIGYNRHGDRDVIVMGGVSYPARLDIDLPYGHGFVCFVNIGEVTFVPSREALRDTANTKATIAALADEYAQHVIKAAQDDVQAADSPAEAIRRICKWENALPRNVRQRFNGFTFNGGAIPDTIPGPFTVTEAHGTLGYSRTSATLSTNLIPQTVFVHNYDLANFTPTHKKKLLMAIEQHPGLESREVRSFALSPARRGDTWVSEGWRLDWNDVKALKLPKTTAQAAAMGGSQRISGSYDVSIDGSISRGLPAADFDLSGGRRLVWVQCGKWQVAGMGAALEKAGVKNFLLVQLTANRVEKFKRDFPNAHRYEAFVASEYAAWAKTIPADKRDALALHASQRHVDTLSRMDAAKVNDPAVKRAIKLARVDVRDVQKRDAQFRTRLHTRSEPITFNKADAQGDVLEPYPLIDHYAFRISTGNNARREHIYNYMNDVYARQQASAGAKVAIAA